MTMQRCSRHVTSEVASLRLCFAKLCSASFLTFCLPSGEDHRYLRSLEPPDTLNLPELKRVWYAMDTLSQWLFFSSRGIVILTKKSFSIDNNMMLQLPLK